MAKKSASKKKQTGYVPFSRDDIHVDDGRNTQAEELFLEMLDVPKRVVKKKKKGKAASITDDDFYPTSMSEVNKMEDLMNQVEVAIDDRSDSEFMDNVAFMKDVLAWSKQRHWEFAWWIVGCVFIVGVYFLWQAGSRADDRKKTENMTEEALNAEYTRILNADKERVVYYEKLLAEETIDKATRKDYTESLERAEKLLKERTEGGTKGYKESLLKYDNRRVWASRTSAIWCFVWLVLYIIAERPYGYMISKRRVELKLYSGMRKALFGVAGAFVGMAGALQVTETITTWSDGSKTRDNDALMIYAMKLGFLAAAVLLVLFVARIVIVIATIMGFIRNYDLIALSKQAVNKSKQLTAKQTP